MTEKDGDHLQHRKVEKASDPLEKCPDATESRNANAGELNKVKDSNPDKSTGSFAPENMESVQIVALLPDGTEQISSRQSALNENDLISPKLRSRLMPNAVLVADGDSIQADYLPPSGETSMWY